MRKRLIIAGALVAVHVAPLYAAEPPSVEFRHVDWEIACDNTRTCRAAGYQSEEYEDGWEKRRLPVSVLLVRKAGPHQAVTAELMVMPKVDDPTPVRGAVEMKINGRSSGYVQFKKRGAANDMLGEMSAAQANALVAALPTDSVIKFSDGRTIWTLSTHGAAAVLLKMDEFQGRIGTTGALLRKGNKPEDGVLPPLPMPVVLVAAVPDSKEGEDPLAGINRPLLLAELRKDEDCEEIAKKKIEDIELVGRRLSKDKLLVSAQCWMGNAGTGDGYWVINRKPPYAPVLVTTDGEQYENGEITKRSFSYDCMGQDVWTWDGQQFSHTLSTNSDMCRGFPGGAWEMIQYVASVPKPGTK